MWLGAVAATQGSTTWNFLLLDQWVFPERKAPSQDRCEN